MPVKDRAWCIDQVLRSIDEQDLPKERIQLVFVDGYSTDGTYEKLSKWTKDRRRHYADISLLQASGKIPEVRNRCIKLANGHYVVFWDSDVVAPSNGLKTLLGHAREPHVGIAGLPYDVDEPSIFDKVCRAREPEGPSRMSSVTMGFTLVKREVLDKVGLFNEKLVGYEDREFCLRARRAGYAVVFDPTVRCRHLKPEVFVSGRYRERKGKFDYARFLWFNFAKAPTLLTETIKVSPRHLLRVLYYLFLPIALAMALLVIALGHPLSLLMAGAGFSYVLFSMAYYVATTRGIYALIAPLIFVPGGIALAYGTALLALKSLLHRLR